MQERLGRDVGALARQLEPGDVEAWAALEANAIEPNAYLSPHFVIPALKWLERDPHSWHIAILEQGPPQGREMRALAVLKRARPSRQFPAPHFVAHRSVHSFLGGVLIHKDRPSATVADLLERLGQVYGHGLLIPFCRSQGPFAAALAAAVVERCWRYRELGGFSRAILRPKGEQEYWADPPLRRLKEFRRKLRKLGETGWDPAYAKLSPMIAAEFLFVREAPAIVPDLVRIDSGAE